MSGRINTEIFRRWRQRKADDFRRRWFAELSTARKVRRVALVGTVAYFVAINVPRKESLPPFMLRHRILCEGSMRILECVRVGARIYGDYRDNCLMPGKQDDAAAWSACHTRSAEKLVALAEQHGALYVKAGQGFASMNHLLPPEYCKVMSKLQDAVVFRPFSEIRYVVEQELGQSLETAFEAFDPNPIAAASLAQVHKAVLRRRDGTAAEAAVKVQYIDVRDRFDGDMYTITSFLKVAARLFPGYDFAKIIGKTEAMLRAELDFVAEASNCNLCREQMKERFGDRVTTPEVFPEATTARVMTTRFIHAAKANDRPHIEALGLSVREVGTLFADAFAHQIFNTGFVHADPHPGNVFVRPRPGGRRGEAQLVILDHGLYTKLSDEQRTWVSQVWTASVTHDDDVLKAACEKVGLPRDAFGMLGSVFLCYPYHHFNPFRKVASKATVDEQRAVASQQMWRVTLVLDRLPPEVNLVLRNINTARSVFKDLGNPVSRTARMLRFSMQREQLEAGTSVWALRWALARLWAIEAYEDVLYALARWRDPAGVKAAEEIFQLG